MKVFRSKEELLAYLESNNNKKDLGFIPTMGALHEGHLKLVEQAKSQCDTTICSIFINPTQFNNDKDLENYPRTLNSDLTKLKEIKCNIVYIPTVSDLYKEGEKAKEFNFGSLTTAMEGAFRPGHFNGMATIIEKFFHLIKPKKAYFGQKDLQQLQIVRALVKQMKSKIEIVGVPTLREKNGLAKSSRNKLLSKNGKSVAALINKCLLFCKDNKSEEVKYLDDYANNLFAKNTEIELEYIEFVSLRDMLPITKWEAEKESAICIAAYIDGVRLIDNIIL